MSHHEGVSCDSCNKSNFRGKRYKCLICFDYDLCSTCYETGVTTTRHQSTHPMQCIITRSDFEFFYGGESLQYDQATSYAFVCPYCGKQGLTDGQLYDHVLGEHSNSSSEVICPVCAALPGGDPNHMTDDLGGHLSMEHRPGTNRDMEEPLSRNIRRIFAPVRNIPPPRSRRAAQQLAASISNSNSMNSSGIATFSSARESIDPIAELLSQLSGVRRAAQQQSAATTASQLQLLQQQLQFERQQVQQARERLERLPRKQPTPPSNSNTSSSSSKKTDNSAAEQNKFLLNQYYAESSNKEETKEAIEQRNQRQLFTKEIVFSLLASEYNKFAYEAKTGNDESDNSEECKQQTYEKDISDQVFQLTLVNNNDNTNQNDTTEPACSGVATARNSSRTDLDEELRLQKQCSDSQDLTSFEVDDDHNNTVS